MLMRSLINRLALVFAASSFFVVLFVEPVLAQKSHPQAKKQSWQILTSERKLDETYINKTGRPIQISVTTENTVTSKRCMIKLMIKSELVAKQTLNDSAGAACNITITIPAGADYSAAADQQPDIKLTIWAELR